MVVPPASLCVTFHNIDILLLRETSTVPDPRHHAMHQLSSSVVPETPAPVPVHAGPEPAGVEFSPRLFHEDPEEEGDGVVLELKLGETLQDPRESQAIVARLAEVQVARDKPRRAHQSQAASAAAVQSSKLHAVEIQHEGQRVQHFWLKPLRDALDFIGVEGLRQWVHALFTYGKEPLDESVFLLQQSILATPLSMDLGDRDIVR